jgi:hypothetical protein
MRQKRKSAKQLNFQIQQIPKKCNAFFGAFVIPGFAVQARRWL